MRDITRLFSGSLGRLTENSMQTWHLAVEIRGAFDESWPSLVCSNNAHVATDKQPVGSVQCKSAPLGKHVHLVGAVLCSCESS